VPVVSAATLSRPFSVRQPAGHLAGKRPLILALHGYGASSEILNKYVPIAQLADEVGALLVTPDGTADSKGSRFWNATDACCNFEKSNVNDLEYLQYIIDEAIAKHDADPDRIFVIGYSNGGFMAHRLACELSEKVAAIASVSGSTFASAERCVPKRPVAVLQVHGNADPSVHYEGGHTVGRTDFPVHPSALQTVTTWANLDHCKTPSKVRGKIDIEDKLAGAETEVRYFDGCEGGGVELWTVDGGGHMVGMKKAGIEAIWGFLKAHPRGH
jgi:polyhydroxybutyrate depolymerase